MLLSDEKTFDFYSLGAIIGFEEGTMRSSGADIRGVWDSLPVGLPVSDEYRPITSSSWGSYGAQGAVHLDYQ